MYSQQSSDWVFSTTERVVTFFAFDSNEISILQESEREANLKWKLFSIQLSIAIMIDCIILLSRIVQSRKRIRTWKIIWNWFQNNASKTNYFDATRNLEQTTNDSNIWFRWCFHSHASIVSSFRLLTTITRNQKHQINWKSSRNLSKLRCETNFCYFILKSSSNNLKTTISIVLFIKNQNIEHFQELIERCLQQEHIRIFLSGNLMTISTIIRDFNENTKRKNIRMRYKFRSKKW